MSETWDRADRAMMSESSIRHTLALIESGGVGGDYNQGFHEALVWVLGEDRSSSASRRQYIDTGRYLTHAETAQALTLTTEEAS